MATCDGRVTDEAFITLATNDVYTRGALVLAESLKKQGTTRQLVVMITPHVSPSARSALEDTFDVVRMVDVLDSRDAAHLACLKRPELGVTFTKIHCWTFTEYQKCVFMDADMMALQNIDDLFQREELSAAPDSGWPDIFNSGLFVFRPSLETFNNLLLLAETEGSFDGGDQGLLNTYFSNWSRSDISRHLPFLYNLHVSASYQYLPAFKRFGKDTKVVHFLGPIKPWHHVYNKATGHVQEMPGTSQSGVRHFPEYLNEWWRIYNEKVQKYFSKEEEARSGRKFSWNSEEDAERWNEHEDRPSHREAHEPSAPSNPFHWELPHTFFKTQPNYDAEETPPPPRPIIKVTPPSTASLPQSESTHPHHGHLPHRVDHVHKVSTTNPSLKDKHDKASLLHGDPNVLVNPPDHQFVPVDEDRSMRESEESSVEMMAPDSSHDITLTPPLSPTGAMAKPPPQTKEEIQSAKMAHMEAWQRGDVDYMGVDKFANIQAALDTFLS